jgi:hypothetical protein
MSGNPIKKRVARAKRKAAADLRGMGYFVFKADSLNASLIGFRKTDIRIVRVVLDKITPFDRAALRAIPAPGGSCSSELWLRQYGAIAFEKSKA